MPGKTIKIFLIIAINFLFIFGFVFGNTTMAQEGQGIEYTPEVGIPGTDFKANEKILKQASEQGKFKLLHEKSYKINNKTVFTIITVSKR